MHIPRIIISGLSGGSGKTMLSLGLARALANAGLRLRAFKKGPDYIDAAWLAGAARSAQGNLDPFFTPGPGLRALFAAGARGCDLALVEGNRGLFDGLDIAGSCSTAELARTLDAPLLLIVDCTKMTRTTAALVKGCLEFEPGLRLGGVILNRTGTARHRELARRAVEELAGVPVLGVLPRREAPFILERHMGLAGLEEFGEDGGTSPEAEALLDALADFVAGHADIPRILELARSAPDLPGDEDPPGARDAEREIRTPEPAAPGCPPPSPAPRRPRSAPAARPRIGYARDAAFWFYYRENLDALVRAGAGLLPVSPLSPEPWPEIDGLYLGGGLPEMHAAPLSQNRAALERIAEMSAHGLPVYAECGGFLLLCRGLLLEGREYPMAGVFPWAVEFCPKPQGLGYVEAEVIAANPFHPAGTRLRGHEFHFSRCADGPEPASLLLRLERGRGLAPGADGKGRDGLLRGRTFASYTHIYAPAAPHWAPAFVAACREAGGGGR